MPRTYVRKRVHSYSDASLELAVRDVENGKSIYNASKEHNIPYETLRRWVVKRPSHKESGKLTVLTLEEENIIVQSLKFLALCGYPQDRKDLKFIVQNFVKTLPPSRAIPFLNGVPGADWIRNFEKRWRKELGNRKPELLTKARAGALTHSVVNQFFDTYEALLKDNSLLNSPERIFNLDEVGLGTDSRNCGVFVAKNSRTAYLKSPTAGKTMYTVLFCASADGKYMPPFTVYKSLHLYDTWTRGGPPGAMYGCTDSGWMHDTVFEQWIKNFANHVNNLQKPVLLIYDGHGSHLTYETIKHAMEKQIIILCLPPHTSHALQPLDVGVFSPLKRRWKDILQVWFRESRMQNISKAVFPMLLGKLYDTLSSANIIKGFKGSGIFPPNRGAVAHRITPTANDITTLQSTSSVENSNISPSVSTSTSQQVISSPYKDLKSAILHSISPKPSNLTTKCIENAKLKRKRVQAKTGEILTTEEVMLRLQNESEKRNAKIKTDKRKSKKFHKVQDKSDDTNEIPKRNKDLPMGSWVKVEYLGKMKKQEFIGKIMSVEGDMYEVKYLKKSQIGNFYVFPEAEDTDYIEKTQVIGSLNEPTFNNRGHYFFDL